MQLTVVQLKPAPLVVSIQGNDLTLVANTPTTPGSGGVTVHGLLTGKDADDHLQYHTDARGDLRYYSKAYVDSALAAIATSLSGKEPNIAAGTVNDYWRGDKSWQVLNKASVGLSNVDNTSDANKPVSSAQATINAAKADLVAGVVPVAQIPAIAITDYLGAVASQAAMLALAGQKGDWCVRTDLSKVYVITGADPTQLADWTALVYPSSGAVWGAMTGTLSDQVDLWAELGLKALAANPVFTDGMSISGQSLTGSQATSLFSGSTTWNTTGTPTALDINVSHTASHANSLLANFRINSTTKAAIHKDGGMFPGGIGQVGIIPYTNTDMVVGSLSSYYARLSPYSGGGNNNPVFMMSATGRFGFASAGGATNTGDVFIERDAANTLALRNQTNAQNFKMYETYTDSSNWGRGSIGFTGGDFIIQSEKLGTGSVRQLHMKALLHRFYVGSGASTVAWYINSDGSFTYEGSANGSIKLKEQTAPSAPATNAVSIYAVDNGAGKTQLMALFATGAAQQIAIEP